MKIYDVKTRLQLTDIYRVSPDTVVVVRENGSVRPATQLEQKMWNYIKEEADDEG